MKKTTYEAAAEYAAKDYFISQRTEQLTNAFNAGASWMFNNQWHDIYEELPPRSGMYMVLYAMDPEISKIPFYIDVLPFFKENIDEGNNPWSLDDGSEHLANALTHWAFIPAYPKDYKLRDGVEPCTRLKQAKRHCQFYEPIK